MGNGARIDAINPRFVIEGQWGLTFGAVAAASASCCLMSVVGRISCNLVAES
jgi:hypothetical protein